MEKRYTPSHSPSQVIEMPYITEPPWARGLATVFHAGTYLFCLILGIAAAQVSRPDVYPGWVSVLAGTMITIGGTAAMFGILAKRYKVELVAISAITGGFLIYVGGMLLTFEVFAFEATALGVFTVGVVLTAISGLWFKRAQNVATFIVILGMLLYSGALVAHLNIHRPTLIAYLAMGFIIIGLIVTRLLRLSLIYRTERRLVATLTTGG